MGFSVQKSECMKMASSYSSVLPPEGTRAAVSGFNDRNKVLLLLPPVRPLELAEPGRELVQQRQNLGGSSSVPLVLHAQRGVWDPRLCPKTMWQNPSSCLHTTRNQPAFSHWATPRPGALNTLCLTSSWFIAFVKVTLNILMVIILSRV